MDKSALNSLLDDLLEEFKKDLTESLEKEIKNKSNGPLSKNQINYYKKFKMGKSIEVVNDYPIDDVPYLNEVMDSLNNGKEIIIYKRSTISPDLIVLKNKM